MGFFEEVYSVVAKIPKGKVATYGQVAKMCGRSKGGRLVGWALHANPRPGEIPCHRVVDRHGNLSQAFAFGGIEQQKRLLEQEGIIADESGKIDLNRHQWR